MMYVNGKIIGGKGSEVEVINPATEEVVDRFNGVSPEQVQKALNSASKAFGIWSSLSLNERSEWIHKLKDEILNEKKNILELLMSETGKPLNNAVYDFNMLTDCLSYFIEEAKRLDGSIINDYDNRFRNLIIRQPLGVVLGYLAWNFPLLNMGYKLGPVLASGCTCVLRPATKTPLATLYVGKVAEKIGFPDGVFNIIAGGGREVTNILNKSSIPKLITTIGSSFTGKKIIEESSTSIKRFSLELGGNAPAIVLADADVDNAAKNLVELKFTNTGQVCVSPNRVYVHENIYDKFIERVKGYLMAVKMGPMISNSERERVLGIINEAVTKGAKVVYGGKIPKDRKKGYFLEPTILDNVSDEMRCSREEIFGPVMPIKAFKNVDEAVKSANNCEYGLASYLFSNDVNMIFEVAEKLEYGTVCVNEPFYAVNLPHGGIKESGIGKDCSKYSLEEYYYIKRISIRK